MNPHRRRAAAALLTTGLLATLLPLLAATPAQAAACTDETYGGNALLGWTGCDDVTPPDTTITAVEPAPTPLGATRSTTVTFAFAGSHADGESPEAAPIGFECQLYATTEAPQEWQACTSPKVYTDLADTTTTPYTFRVRAIDTEDQAIRACDGTAEPLFDPLCNGEETVEDVDATPATTTVSVDTVAPNTFLNRQPVDPIRPDLPVVGTASPTLELNSNEVAGFLCTLNGRSLTPCGRGLVTMPNLKGGGYTFVARAYDAAFNIDPTPVTTSFYVPTDIRQSKKQSRKSGWKTRRQAHLFGNDYLTSSTVGQTLVLPAVKNVREVRLLAPTGPTYGKVEVRIGTSQWYTVNLYSRRSVALAQLVVRDEYTLPRSGPIQIRVKELAGKRTSVRVDAIVARAD